MNVVFRSDARKSGKGFRMDVMCFNYREPEFQTGELTETPTGEVSARLDSVYLDKQQME